MTIRTLIVDDEPLAREGIQLLLEREQDVMIVGQCANGTEAIRAVLELKPDLVFLDVKMPRVTGFEVIKAIGPENMPPVIFLTAYEEHAIRAFEVKAIDYMLKPISPDRFSEALERARQSLKMANIAHRSQQLRELLDSEPSLALPERERIVVRSAGHVHFVKPSQIRWIEANGDYVTIHEAQKQHLVRDTMQTMQRKLSAYGFQRIHRSTIVNVECVAELIATPSGDYQVVLDDGEVLKLSRSYRDDLYARMSA